MSSIKRFMPVNKRLCYLQMAGWNFDIEKIKGSRGGSEKYFL